MPTPDELTNSAPARFPLGENLTRPACWNRPDYPEGELVIRQGYHEVLAILLGLSKERIRFRWAWRKMSTGCRAWHCLPSETPAPVLDNYDCRGCRHMPARAKHHFNREECE